ncbi:asparaginase [uncultured archaeon]|nr:asparaginase [uncultured archaeon]
MPNMLLLHGGVGSDKSKLEYLNSKLNDYAKVGSASASPLENVVNAVVKMEDDEDFNAGTGSVMRIDGSIQMDAAVMIPGDFGSVIAIERVKNPILVARDVLEKSPHIMLASDGAVKFARTLGYEEYDPSTGKARSRLEKVLAELRSENAGISSNVAHFKKFVNSTQFVEGSCDTVGAVARMDGKFAAAVSTGGSSPMMRGRVGDSPVLGAGIYCGPKGAVVATGIGEEIAKNILCYRTYAKIGSKPLKEILKEEVDSFGQTLIGLIAVDKDDYAHYDNGSMAVGTNNLEQ